MQVIPTELEGVLIIEPKKFGDNRGFFFETFQAERYHQQGITQQFVQDNFSHSEKGTVRGLHYQLEKPQGKLVFVLYGRVMDVILDIRPNSKTFGKVITVELDVSNPRQVYIPPGLAHGFEVLSETAGFCYKCTDYYHPASEFGVCWNDPDLNIQWSTDNPKLSAKDALYPRLKDITQENLPK